jgi:hypothetical protein
MPPFVFIDVRSGLRYEDNLVGDDELSFDTALSAGFFAATSNRRLSLEGGVLLRALEGEHSITDPFLTASYAIFSRESELSFDLEYRATDLDDRVIDDAFDAGDLIQDGGRRERLEAGIGLVTGRFAPFGTDTRLRYRQTTFSADAGEDDERFPQPGEHGVPAIQSPGDRARDQLPEPYGHRQCARHRRDRDALRYRDRPGDRPGLVGVLRPQFHHAGDRDQRRRSGQPHLHGHRRGRCIGRADPRCAQRGLYLFPQAASSPIPGSRIPSASAAP